MSDNNTRQCPRSGQNHAAHPAGAAQPSAGSFNAKLSLSCQAKASACCKKGLLFMPAEEVSAIDRFISASHDGAALDEFHSRLKKHEGFFLYNQQNACQFLDAGNLCLLHGKGIKPRECFWWPYHVYFDTTGKMVIAISKTCCDAWKHHEPEIAAQFCDDIEDCVNGCGEETVRRFRDAYAGSYGHETVREISPLVFRKIRTTELEIYKKRGMQFFPEADWKNGIGNYAEMLRLFPDGLQAAWIGGRIIGYISLWPLKKTFGEKFKRGAVRDDDLSPSDIERAAPPRIWFLRAIAVQSASVQLHRKVRDRLTRFMLSRISACGVEIFAQAVSRQGENYLLKNNFQTHPGFPGDLFFRKEPAK
ncbi:MAG: hypothetical protein LBC18_04200 [Opitutaceae bacterium]|jgi:hypothetical protein|nr:hypothetical protein [Opitutaceae bacterium]